MTPYDIIRQYLIENKPVRFTITDIQKACELSRYNVQKEFARLKEEALIEAHGRYHKMRDASRSTTITSPVISRKSVNSKIKTILLVISDSLHESFWADLMDGAMRRVANKDGYELAVLYLHAIDEYDRKERLFMEANSHRYDGFIISLPHKGLTVSDWHRFASKYKTVFVDRKPINGNGPAANDTKWRSVTYNNYNAALNLVEMLVAKDCKPIYVLGESWPYLEPMDQRIEGVKEAFNKHPDIGTSENIIFGYREGEIRRVAGEILHKAMPYVLDKTAPKVGIVCLEDAICEELLMEFRDQLNILRDYKVAYKKEREANSEQQATVESVDLSLLLRDRLNLASFDNTSPLLKFAQTISAKNPSNEMASRAVDCICQWIETGQAPDNVELDFGWDNYSVASDNGHTNKVGTEITKGRATTIPFRPIDDGNVKDQDGAAKSNYVHVGPSLPVSPRR